MSDPYEIDWMDWRWRTRMEFGASMAVAAYHFEDAPDPLYAKPPHTVGEKLAWIKRVFFHGFAPEQVKVIDRAADPRMFAIVTGITA